jgi:hypothetical protein
MNSVETGEDPLDGAKVGENRVSVMSPNLGTPGAASVHQEKPLDTISGNPE